ncbi:solute:proton antiporter [Aureococcus anophagefferens]|nr:solute:proton antiporter [Aureococcus anophagefferens]
MIHPRLLLALLAAAHALIAPPRPLAPARLPHLRRGRGACAVAAAAAAAPARGARRGRLVPAALPATPRAAGAPRRRAKRVRGRSSASSRQRRSRGAAAASPGAALEGSRAAMAAGLGESWRELAAVGARRDSLVLLLATATVIPLAKRVGLSPILGFLATGVFLGPNGGDIISNLHQAEILAELGVVFFLFEMGLELSVAKIGAMRTEIFGLGFAQFVVTALVLGRAAVAVGAAAGSTVSFAAATAIGGALSLSSSAFVLQLLRDQDELGTSHGRASLGVLLLQDLAVVPLLVLLPLLASGNGGAALAAALGVSALKAVFAILSVEVVGKNVLNTMFARATKSRSQEAFLSVVLLSVLGISAFTEAVGLSATLGAFVAGVCLSETRYVSQVEASVAPLRGLLLGLFFVTVGFSIDVNLLLAKPAAILGLSGGLLALKAGTLFALGRLFRLPGPTALRTGALLAQGGEFGFVAFALATKLELISEPASRVLLTVIALSMAATPLLAGVGGAAATAWARKRRESAAVECADEALDYRRFGTLIKKSGGDGADADADAPLSPQALREDLAAKVRMKDVVVVLGYGAIGRVVTEMLDAKLCKYVVIESDKDKAEKAAAAGRPVFRGDATDGAVLEKYLAGDARLVVVAVNEEQAATDCVTALKKLNAQLPILARAADETHRRRLARLRNVQAVVPAIKSDSRLLSLPFGGAVLRGLGYRADDVDMLIEENRRAEYGLFDTTKEKKRPAKEEKRPVLLRDDDDDDDDDKTLMEEVGVSVVPDVVEERGANATRADDVVGNATAVSYAGLAELAPAAVEDVAPPPADDAEAPGAGAEKPGASLEVQQEVLKAIADAQRNATRAIELAAANATANETAPPNRVGAVLQALADDYTAAEEAAEAAALAEAAAPAEAAPETNETKVAA